MTRSKGVGRGRAPTRYSPVLLLVRTRNIGNMADVRADGAAAERVEPAKEVGAADPLHRLAGRAAAHRQDDGAADKARSALVR